MNAPQSNSPPPESAEHVVGELIEFSPTDDLANPGGATSQLQPVQLTPVGHSAACGELRPTDDKLAHPDNRDIHS